jgi:hypothetical protein
MPTRKNKNIDGQPTLHSKLELPEHYLFNRREWKRKQGSRQAKKELNF